MGTEHPAYREQLRGHHDTNAAPGAHEPYRPLAATGGAVPRLSSAE
jgi:hypothetical protein